MQATNEEVLSGKMAIPFTLPIALLAWGRAWPTPFSATYVFPTLANTTAEATEIPQCSSRARPSPPPP
jgi:hypothetical protein